MSDVPKVPRRIAAVIVNSLKGGVVPRIGLPYITVGREREIQALLHDLELVADGGASFRFLVGRYGAGKSFLLQTIRTHAMGNDFVVTDADLSPERRLQGGQGQGLATYRELVRNLSTKTRPEGGALQLVLDRWVAALREQPDVETALADQLSPPSRARLRLRLHAGPAPLLPGLPRGERRAPRRRGQVAARRVPHQDRGPRRARRERLHYGRHLVRVPQALRAVPRGRRLQGPRRPDRRAREPLQDSQRHLAPVQLREDPHHVQRHPPGQGAPPGNHHGRRPAVHRGPSPRRLLLRGGCAAASRRVALRARASRTCSPRSFTWSPSPTRSCSSS